MLSALAKTRCRDKAEQIFEIMAEAKRKLPFGELAAAVRRLAAGGLIEEAGGVYELCGALKTASRGKYYKGAAWKGEFFAAAEETARRFAAEELPDGAAEGAPAFTAEEYADGAKLYQRYILRPLQKRRLRRGFGAVLRGFARRGDRLRRGRAFRGRLYGDRRAVLFFDLSVLCGNV